MCRETIQSEPAAPVVVLDGVHKAYRAGIPGCWAEADVLRGVDLVISPGEVVGLAGGIGSGKTTLLHIAARLLRPTLGAVSWPAIPEPHGRYSIGYVAEEPYYASYLTPKDILVRFTSENRWWYGEDSPVCDLLRALELQKHLSTEVRFLDRGTRQRIALAEAVLINSPLFLVDGLYGESSRAMVRKLASEGKGIIVTAQNPYGLADVATRTFVIEEGRLRPAYSTSTMRAA